MKDIEFALQILKKGGIIAYPTEAVFGLGCDPFNEIAVQKILNIKKRDVEKGLILIAASWEQVKELTQTIPDDRLKIILGTWPGPFTWVFPAAPRVSKWIKGGHNSVALRVTDHPIAKLLCEKFGRPIVSTSANFSGEEPVRNFQEAQKKFSNLVDFILPGETGSLNNPTIIKDALTGKVLRS